MAEEVDSTGYRRTYPSQVPRKAASSSARAGAIARRAAPKKYSYRPPRISSGSSGRYSRPMAPPAAAPGPMDVNAFLGGDVGYQDQLRQIAKTLSDFNADVTRRRGSLTSDYGVSSKALGDQRGLDLENIESDYGGRGLLRSGLYSTAVGDYEKEYNERAAELVRRRDEALAMLTQESSQFSTQQELQKQAAREAAIRRRAEGLGI